ncbi:hypothetical protein B0H65DRAFT_429206 [Neurospora tetraspora]|uniref:DUF7587 domain-containing protein n=1 Tax=Neurospora tetraspora TaxID=94610 RepID=A0AAE0MRB1_9PEZI|nr:hypothetical protein B0H65DRAFT_429206 [Neurospora tetraspora]
MEETPWATPRPWRLTDCFMTPELLPHYLYYVRHGTSQTSFGPNGDIHTKNPDKRLAISSRGELKELVRRHLDWSSRGPSLFISTFFDKSVAWLWGSQREPIVVMYTISTRRLPAHWPVVCAGVHTQNAFDADFLFLSYIPSQAIVRVDTIRPPLPEVLAAVDYSVPPAAPTLQGFVPPPPYVGPYPTPHNQFAPTPVPAPAPPYITSTRPPPQYSAPQHFTSPPYTTPAQYITPVPPVGTPSRVPREPGNEAHPRSESSYPCETGPDPSPAPHFTSPPHTPPGQITTVQPVESPPQVPPQLKDGTSVSELPVSSVTEPSIASDPELDVEPKTELVPEVDSDLPATPKPKTPVDKPETPVNKPETPVQSNPERAVKSNPETPAGTKISFFAEDSELTSSPVAERAVNSNPDTPAPVETNINFFAEN